MTLTIYDAGVQPLAVAGDVVVQRSTHPLHSTKGFYYSTHLPEVCQVIKLQLNTQCLIFAHSWDIGRQNSIIRVIIHCKEEVPLFGKTKSRSREIN